MAKTKESLLRAIKKYQQTSDYFKEYKKSYYQRNKERIRQKYLEKKAKKEL